MLQNKVVVITGAKGGLGTELTEACLAAGASVVGISRSISDKDFSSERFRALPAELTSGEAARSAAGKAIAIFGRVDGLVHTVGGFAGGSPVVDTDDSTAEHMMAVNYFSAFFTMRAILPHMRATGKGSIVAVGSRAAVEPAPNAAAYSASKAALVALVRTVAAENAASGISANIILPGTIDTRANREAMPKANFGSWVQPAQIATLAISLLSDNLTQISGAAIPIYGLG